MSTAKSETPAKPPAATERKRPAVRMPTPAEDAAINAAARSDPDAQPLTRQQLDAMVPMRALRGRPPLANKKQLVSVRYSPEVLDWFRATGAGWQARMDEVLRAYVKRRSGAPETRS